MARKDIVNEISTWRIFEKTQDLSVDDPMEEMIDLMVETLQQISAMGGPAGALADACLSQCSDSMTSAAQKKKKKNTTC